MTKQETFIQFFKQHNHYDVDNGLNFTINTPGDISYRMTIQQKHLSSPQVAHGAVLAGLMDCTLGLAALSLAIEQDNLTSTVEFKMNFIRPAKLGDKLVGHGKVEHHGKSLLISTAEIRLADTGELIGKGLGTFNTYPLSKKSEILTGLAGNTHGQ